ncbi:MAG: hypothetical protein M3R02_29110 [Chloroflexota bacterium]|nr:hypothetical protein [Chloroflexota bacterium]
MPAAPTFLGLARLTYAPGATVPALRADGPTILHVETGSLTVQTGEAAGQATPTADGATVNEGQQLLIPANTSFATRNDGTEPASVLRVVLYRSAPEPVAAPGITFQRLAAEVAPTLPSGRAFVTVNRLTLTAGASTVTRTQQADGPDLAYVEVGTLGLAGPGIDVTLSAGNTAFVDAGVDARARNAGFGPLVLLVVSVSTEAGDAGISTPEAGTPTS